MAGIHLRTIGLNFGATLLLLGIITSPFYIAKNLNQVAGVKSESLFLVTSQIDKFPLMKLEQSGNTYKISFEKIQSSQAFTQVLLLTNPTSQTKIYKVITKDDQDKVFFGENHKDLQDTVTAPSKITIPISILANSQNLVDSVEFEIQISLP